MGMPTLPVVQVLVYFAVAKKGDPPIDGKTDVNPEGLTAGVSRRLGHGQRTWGGGRSDRCG